MPPRASRYSSSLASGSMKFASNGVFVYPGSMTETRMSQSGNPRDTMLGIGAQCSTGKLRMSAMRNLPVVLICRMATALPNTPNQLHVSACSVPTRGAYRDRHGRWVRDAMDATAAVDEGAALR